MQAADLDDGAKKHLLGLMRDQLGESKYAELRRTQSDDQIIDMMLMAAEHQQKKVAAARAEVWENDRVGYFWVFWIVLSLIVGAFTSVTTGLMWFCSPWWFFFLAGGYVIPHRKWWGAVIVAIILMIGFFYVLKSTGRDLDDKEVLWYFLGGGLSALALVWIAGAIASRR